MVTPFSLGGSERDEPGRSLEDEPARDCADAPEGLEKRIEPHNLVEA